MGQRTALDGLHIVAEPADDLNDFGQLAGLVVQREQQREAVARRGALAAEHDEAGGVVAVCIDAGHQHFQPVEGGRLHAGDCRLGDVAAFGHELCRHGGVGHGVGRQAELLQKGLALGNGLLVAVDASDLVEPGARQHQKILRDGQIIHIHHPQVRVVIAQVQHGGHVACVAVLKGHHAVGGVAALHRVEHLVPCGIAHRFSMGEQRPQGNVGKGTLHALIGGAVLPQNLRLVLLGHVHHVLDMVFIVGPQGRLLNACGGFLQHGSLPGCIVNGQTVGTFVFGHLQHGSHPPLEQRSQLGVHRVDLGAGLFQCVHGFTSFSVSGKRLLYKARYPVSIP